MLAPLCYTVWWFHLPCRVLMYLLPLLVKCNGSGEITFFYFTTRLFNHLKTKAMEQRHKVRLSTSSTFDLEQNEIKRLYIYLSLFQYRYLRVPDYKERPLIETLHRDFKKYHTELQKHAEQDPNNLTLSKMRTFFELHYKKLKDITDEYKAQDRESI